jgi:HAD superfamily hydrolase (TIGR01549 family)
VVTPAHPQRWSRFRAVLFDFDRTLFRFDDSMGWLQAALQEARNPMPAEAVRALYDRLLTARASPEVAAEQRHCQRSPTAHRSAHYSWFHQAGADPAVAEALYRRLTNPAAWTPYRDTSTTLAALRSQGIPVAVVSNVGWDIRPTFSYHGLNGMVDTFALSCEHGVEKPTPTLFLIACAALDVNPADTLMVGDDPLNDGAAVRSALHVFLLPDQPLGSCRGLSPILDLLHPTGPQHRR